ncbi:MAG: hypothetical protein IJ728_04505 [Selenomonadaceae bacterium]|nr:hypothetical protein [Selenomonadaceae bacterium]
MNDDKNENQSYDQNDQKNSIKDTTSDIEIKEKSKTTTEESQNGFFSITKKYKWILMISILILGITSILIYAKYNNVLAAEYWQMAIWGLCALLSFYSIIKKSLAATLLNLVLFFGISLMPAWGLVYQFFKPILELLLGTKLPEWHQFYYR